MSRLDVTVRSEFVRSGEGKIRYRRVRAGGMEHYNVRVYVDGSAEELRRVEAVTYELHPSFRNPVHRQTNRASQFELTLWVWGMFDIEVEFELVDGGQARTRYYLRFSLPEDTGDNYVEVPVARRLKQ